MNTRIILTLAVIIITGCAKTNIQNQINEANYCNYKEDCAYAGSKCPFGCYIYVNQEHKEEIKALIDDYGSECVYGCIKCEDVECKDNRCQAVCEASQ